MAQANDHEESARRNEALHGLILSNWNDDYADWALILIFYAAVQWGRAYLAAVSPTTLTNHQGFEAAWFRATKDKATYKHYRRLKDESERARYDCVRFTRNDAETLRDDHFTPWRDWIVRYMPRIPRRP
jgi:hypothetical protein